MSETFILNDGATADMLQHHTFLCFYNRQRVAVRAATKLAARDIAARHFGVKPNKAYNVITELYALFGQAPYVHSTASL
jgi:hypothetical protein